jgi:uncharacterized protein YqgC (DUF456 family)
MDYVWAVLLVVGSFVGWLLNLIGLPGNWLALACCAVYAWGGPNEGRLNIGWGVVGSLCALALVGELIEFLAGAWGARRAGGSSRGAALALAGSVVGGFAGMFVGVPIPVVGPLAGALLFASLGALAGAVVGERWKGRGMDESLRVGNAAFWARMLGTLGKTLVGAVMLALIFAALVA